MQIRMQYASLTTKSKSLPNFGKCKMFHHFLQPCWLPKNWRDLITMTRQHMVKIEGLKFDYQLTNMKPFLIQTVIGNGCPTLENRLEMPSDNFWEMKTSFHKTHMPEFNIKRWLRQDIQKQCLKAIIICRPRNTFWCHITQDRNQALRLQNADQCSTHQQK